MGNSLRKMMLGGLLILGLALFTAGCRKDNQTRIARPAPDLKKGAAHVGQSAGESGPSAGHPYGRPVGAATVLPWEGKTLFQRQLAALGLQYRMAAFQTTLPDPLPGEEANVALAADLLAGRSLGPGAAFSLNRTIGPYRKEKGYRDGPAYVGSKVRKTSGGGVCKIASTLYNVVTLAGLQVLERHAHGMQVPYVPPGQDATVAEGAKDFRFRNNTPGPLSIWADTRGNTLYLAIYGNTKPPKVTWRHQVLKRWPTRTIRRSNSALKPGSVKVAVPGAEGLVVRSELLIEYPDGRVEHRRLKLDVYRPLPEVIESNP